MVLSVLVSKMEPFLILDEIINEKLDFLGELCETSQQEMPFMLSLHRDSTPSPLTVTAASSPTSCSSSGAMNSPAPPVRLHVCNEFCPILMK